MPSAGWPLGLRTTATWLEYRLALIDIVGNPRIAPRVEADAGAANQIGVVTTEHSFLGIGTSHLPSSQAESVTMCEVRSVTYVSGRSNSLTIQAQTDSSRFSLRSRRRRPLNDYPERSARA